jgi:hypothetical protein
MASAAPARGCASETGWVANTPSAPSGWMGARSMARLTCALVRPPITYRPSPRTMLVKLPRSTTSPRSVDEGAPIDVPAAKVTRSTDPMIVEPIPPTT